MINFDFHNPVRLIFGCGKLAMVGTVTKQYGHKALIVTSGSSARSGLLQKVIDHLNKDGLNYVVFDKVTANPLTTLAHEGAIVAKSEKCDVVIGLGGGSAMDAAKAIAFMAINEGDVSDYIFGKPGIGALPLILITTTAGTGSEGNNMGVLTNPENNDKKSIKSPFLYAKASIVDPELLLTLPKRSIAGPGLDALFHAIESYISKKSNPITEIMSLQTIALITENLPKVYEDPSNIEAWEKVALANTLGGMAIDAGGVTLPHALEHPVSGLFNVTHSEGLAALYIPIMKFTYLSAPHKFATIAKTMGATIDGLSIEDAAAKSIECVSSLLTRLHMTPTLGDFGVTEDKLDWLTANALKTMNFPIQNNPRVPTSDEIKEIYRQSL